ncbi:hypothetical protein PG997_000693 [Apiospora hydei]|uniref:Uncharacterized protein n=1 Tax=Apiospora hydei TaxID=1337664 RepID=A0ABR1XBN8_9PEZI
MQGRSLSKWLPKLLQSTPIKKEERSDAPSSHHPLAESTHAAEALSTKAKRPAILQDPETAGGLPDTPPPSYEDACSGPNGASIGAVAGAQRPQNTRIARIVNEVIAQAECKLERLKQVDNSIDIVYISSRIRQLCDFATCCVDEGCQRRRKAKSKEVRQKNQREAEKLFNLVFATVDWTRQGGKKVVGIATCAFRETANQVLAGNEHLKGYWHVRAGFYLMKSGIFKTAGIILEYRAADKDLTQAFAHVTDTSAHAAKCCTAVANL